MEGASVLSVRFSLVFGGGLVPVFLALLSRSRLVFNSSGGYV